MRLSIQLSPQEWRFGALVSSIHGVQHLYTRLLPALIPVLVSDLSFPLWQIGILVSAYLFTGGLFQAPMGVLADIFDRRYLLIPAIVLMSTGYLVFAAAPVIGAMVPDITISNATYAGSYLVMGVGMIVVGLGYSAIHPAGYPTISANVDSDNKGKILGMWASGAKLGDTISPLLVATLILVLSWEQVLVCISLAGLVYAGFLFAVLRTDGFKTQPPERPTGDTPGATNDPLRGRPQQFLLPIVVILLFFTCLLFTTNGFLTYMPVFVVDVYAFSFAVAGLEFQPSSVANLYFSLLLLSGAISQLLVGVLADIFDLRLIIVALLVSASVSIATLSVLPLTPISLLFLTMLVGGLIFGLYPARDALISDLTPAAYEGRTFGYVLTISMVVGSMYPALIGFLAERIGIRRSFALLALGTVLGAVCILSLYSSRVYQKSPVSKTHPERP